MAIRAVKKRGVRRPKADTRDVVGELDKTSEVDPKWKQHYDRLADLHSRLVNRKEDLVQDARQEKPVYSLHMADAGTDTYDRDFALSMISSEQNALYEVEEAMARIKSGTYGVCQLTGEQIEMERLNAIPWTRFSAKAENQLEREGAVARTRYGPREEVPHGDAAEEGEEG